MLRFWAILTCLPLPVCNHVREQANATGYVRSVREVNQEQAGPASSLLDTYREHIQLFFVSEFDKIKLIVIIIIPIVFYSLFQVIFL